MIHRGPLPEDGEPPTPPDHLFQGKQPKARLDPTNVTRVTFGGPGPPEPVTVNLTINLPTKEDCTPLQIGPDGRYIVPGVTADTSLLDRAYAMRYDPAKQPPKEETLMTLGKAPIASNGNVTGLQGKEKVGKTSVVSAILGAALRGNYSIPASDKPGFGDCLGFEWDAKQDRGTIIHFDTEQSPADWHAAATRAICRSANARCVPRLLSIPLVQFSFLERKEIMEQAIAREFNGSGVAIVILDGVADFCKSPNDEEEAIELVRFLMALAHKYDTAIICVLHENPSTDQGKTRGHLGSELTRKAFANVKVEKDDGISIIYGDKMRKKDIPKSQGLCFQWSDEAHMHVSIGTAGQIHAQKIEAKKEGKLDKEAEIADRVFDSDAILDYAELTERIMIEADVKDRSAKGRITSWMKAKIITKTGNGTYARNHES